MVQMLIVAQQKRRTADLGQHHIQIAIAIDIRKGGAAAHYRFEKVLSGVLFSHGHKARAAGSTCIPEELGRLSISLALLNFTDLLFQMPISSEQVEPPIQVVVEKEHAEFEQ